MKITSLTDRELIDHILKFDTDPVRLRLAGIMDKMPGIILDELEDAGMDREFCTFENTYSPGQYVHHLEGEIEWRDREMEELQEKIHNLEARTVAALITELKHEIAHSNNQVIQANKARDAAVRSSEFAHEKLKMWNHLRAE